MYLHKTLAVNYASVALIVCYIFVQKYLSLKYVSGPFLDANNNKVNTMYKIVLRCFYNLIIHLIFKMMFSISIIILHFTDEKTESQKD